MNRLCKASCRTPSERGKRRYGTEGRALRCHAGIRLPRTPLEGRRWNLEAEILEEERQGLARGKKHSKFQCSYEERKRRAEARRKCMAEKLQREYGVNVEDLNEIVLDELIAKVEAMERQKYLREKQKLECRYSYLRRLFEEERCKRRVVRPASGWRRKFRKIPKYPCRWVVPREEEYLGEAEEYEGILVGESTPIYEESEVTVEEPELGEAAEKQIETEVIGKCQQKIPAEFVLGSDFYKMLKQANRLDRRAAKMGSAPAPDEVHLKCSPTCVMFENCEPFKSYVQTYRITNVGTDVVHCRYLGIEATDYDEETIIPFRVDIVDSAVLRPGLSLASKVRMIPCPDIIELHFSLLYEVRRPKNGKDRSCFRVPVSSTPARSIVEVSPSVLRFPAVAWCVAIGPDRGKYLTKTIRIKNAGAKECWCSIVKNSVQNVEEGPEESDVLQGAEGESASENTASWNLEQYGEGYFLPGGMEEAEDIISELLDNVFATFRFDRKYYIPLPAMSVVRVTVDFFPEYKGYHHEIVFVRFEGADNTAEEYRQEKLELIGDVKKLPLRTDPPTIDLKICTISSGVYEGVFKVLNDSNGPFSLRINMPTSMKAHALVFPRNPVVQPWSSQTCSVRLFPGRTIATDAFRYYKEDTKVLEFPVFIQPLGPDFCVSDRIKVHVFAILTDCSLELQPKEVDFGVVSTLETVRTEISVTNHSMTVHEFGFLHLPMGVRIEPNGGFGTILPKETIPLYLIFSPTVNSSHKDVPQGDGDYGFRVKVTSVAEVGGTRERPYSVAQRTEITWGGDEIQYIEGYGGETPPEDLLVPENSEADALFEEDEVECLDEDEDEICIDPAEELSRMEKKRDEFRNYLQREHKGQEVVSTESESVATVTPTSVEVTASEEKVVNEDFWTLPSMKGDLSIMSCVAKIVNANCELSASVILLPATPLSSFSATRIRLSGRNSNPTANCQCLVGRKKPEGKTNKFEAYFEFETKSRLITIEPRSGRIVQGESIPIIIIFRPEFSKSELQHQARILKTEIAFDEYIKDEPPSPSAAKSKSKIKISKAARPAKVEVESQDVNLTGEEINRYDLFAGEKALQQLIDPFFLTIEVVCVVKIVPCRENEETTKEEHHGLVLIAPVVKPSFIFLGKCQEIEFGKVIIGERARAMIELQNVSLKRIAPRITALNPHGSFYLTTGCRIDKVDPEHIWRHPLTYAPMDENGKEIEFFEVRHGKTSVALKVNGEGVLPKYSFSPDFAVCLLETATWAEVEFSVENECGAEIRVQFVADFVKESTSAKLESAAVPEVVVTSGKPEAVGKKEKKNATGREPKKKNPVFMSEISAEMELQLENEFRNVEDTSLELFSMIGLDPDTENLVVPPYKKGTVKIKFTPPPREDPVTSKRKGRTSTSETKKPRSQRRSRHKPSVTAHEPVVPEEAATVAAPVPNAYAVKYSVLLSGTINVKEFTIIGKIP